MLLSSTQAGPGRKVEQEQEEIYRNHVPRLFLGSVFSYDFLWLGALQVGELCRTREAGQPRGHLGPQPVPRDPLRQRHVHLRVLLEDLEVTKGGIGLFT